MEDLDVAPHPPDRRTSYVHAHLGRCPQQTHDAANIEEEEEFEDAW